MYFENDFSSKSDMYFNYLRTNMEGRNTSPYTVWYIQQ